MRADWRPPNKSTQTIVPAGTVRFSPDRFPIVATGNGWLRLVEVQWEGKPRVSGPDFVNGLQPAERDSLRFAAN